MPKSNSQQTSVDTGYAGVPCPNCGRHRVEHRQEKRICEKCNWCIEDNEYFIAPEKPDFWEGAFK